MIPHPATGVRRHPLALIQRLAAPPAAVQALPRALRGVARWAEPKPLERSVSTQLSSSACSDALRTVQAALHGSSLLCIMIERHTDVLQEVGMSFRTMRARRCGSTATHLGPDCDVCSTDGSSFAGAHIRECCFEASVRSQRVSSHVFSLHDRAGLAAFCACRA